MRTLTRLSGEYVTFDQNGAKMNGNIEILLEQPREVIGVLHGFTMLSVQFDELGEVNLK